MIVDFTSKFLNLFNLEITKNSILKESGYDSLVFYETFVIIYKLFYKLNTFLLTLSSAKETHSLSNIIDLIYFMSLYVSLYLFPFFCSISTFTMFTPSVFLLEAVWIKPQISTRDRSL